MAIMLREYDKSHIYVHLALTKLLEKEKDKRKKKKFKSLLLSEEEKEMLPIVIEALDIVMAGSTLLCGNNVSLSTADRVSIFLAISWK